MDNTAEISRNKKQIEELEKLLENSKSKIIGIEHMMAELDVHITHLPDEFQNKKGQFENKLKQLTAHTEVLFKEKSSQARIKLKNIEKDISKNNAILAEIEQDKKKKLSLLKVKREQLKSKIKLENDKVSDLKHKISTLSKVNFELMDAPSHQVKVTLNYDENIILEELVRKQGSNKSSVFRQMLKDYSNIAKEKDAYKLQVEKLKVETNLAYEVYENKKLLETQKFEQDLKLFEQKMQSNLYEAKIKYEAMEEKLKERDRIIEELRDMKDHLTLKLNGENLEKHCEYEFNKIRISSFPNAVFEKQPIGNSSYSGDFIYRDFDKNGQEILSILFEIKNFKKDSKNESYISKLDKARKEQNCEYAVLVSQLEIDNDLYNSGIVDLSYKFPKMYVVRPQFFIPIISLLKNASTSAINVQKDSVKNNNNFDINAEYIKPDNLEELPLIIESLQTGKLVLLNLDSIDLKDRERFTDLIFGAIVGMKGNMKKIASDSYVLSPQNHKVTERKFIKDNKNLNKETNNYLRESSKK